MGGAYRGLAEDHGAIDYNPAGIQQRDQYSVELLYENRDEPDRQLFRGSIIDTLTSPKLGMAFSYSYQNNHTTDQKFQLLFAAKISSVSVGTTLRYASVRHGESEWTNDTGILWKPFDPWLSLGIVGHNLAKVEEVSGFPRQYAIGLASHPSNRLLLTGDFVWEPESPTEKEIRGHLGVELTLVERLPIRAGYIFDEINAKEFVTAGAGILSPRFQLQYGVEFERGSRNQTQSVSISIPF